MENTVDIWFNDLSEERKKEIREAMGLETNQEVLEETNWDAFPMTEVSL